MRKIVWIIAAVILLLGVSGVVQAQDISFRWNRWDVIIDVQADGQALAISEVQEFVILEGTVRFGERAWTDPVEVQNVFVVMGTGSNAPEQLTESDSEEPGTYTVSQSGDETELRYYLPREAQGGEIFIAQINYTAPVTVEGLVDWQVIPDEHAAPIESSTVTINFAPDAVPAQGLVRVASGTGTVTQNGNSFVIQSQGAVPANEGFAVQAPFGEGVGTAGDPADGAVEPAGGAAQAPRTEPQDDSSGLKINNTCLLGVLCVVGLFLLLGGGRLLRGLGGLGPVIGGGQGGTGGIGPFGGGTGGTTGRIPGGGTSTGRSRGFRRSPTQGRSLPRIGRRKGGGGRAGLG